MENLHDFILIAIIGVIIVIQILVFLGNYRKIQDYKRTIQKANDFKIVEVSVPEEWIKNIEVEDILKNPEEFGKVSNEFSFKNKQEFDTESGLNNQNETLVDNDEVEDIEYLDSIDEDYDEDPEYDNKENNKR
ncbi:hypothetical protein [Flavobacteriaceae bacterium 14752]|uniref:hypothetical protein n=1 Tax=Mesohalobacter salilacus TaxID=2491711 RepID=UPI000F643273|nr:hypothetical protein EIG84_12220 [Flavobacteriaceae bacterium 14752]